MQYDLKEILKHFNFDVQTAPYGNGLINETYIIEADPSYILQRINTKVFREPEGLMENILNVTEFLRKKIIANGGDPDRETLSLILTNDGKSYYKADEDAYFRIYKFIDNSCTIDYPETMEQLASGAKAFGKFQRMLDDFPAETLYETIPDFHNTPVRFEAFKKAVKDDIAGRLKDVQKEVEFFMAREKDASIVTDGIKSGDIPLRVTHNDTKFNNVLFDKDTKEGVCVIDLDTVMPGSLLYDYGDALRFAGSSGAEDEVDLSKIYFNLDAYKYFTLGYLSELKPYLTKRETELIPFSVKLMTFECGIRFLGDYLNGDTYFKTTREHHNLDRARTHIKLIADMESKKDEMNAILSDILKKV